MPESNYERDQLERQKMIELKKQLAEEKKRSTEKPEPQNSSEELTEAERYRKENAPKTFKEKWDNYWYHYKGRTFALTFGGVLLLILVFNIVFQTQYDINVVLATSDNMSEVENGYINGLKQYAVDVNQNGSVDLTATSLEVTSGGNNGMLEIAMRMKLSTSLMSDNISVFIVDDEIYDYIVSEEPGLFVNLEELYPDNPNIEGQRYYIKGTPLEQAINLKGIPNDYSVCIRESSWYEEKNDEDVMKTYEGCLQMVKNIITDQKTNVDTAES